MADKGRKGSNGGMVVRDEKREGRGVRDSGVRARP